MKKVNSSITFLALITAGNFLTLQSCKKEEKETVQISTLSKTKADEKQTGNYTEGKAFATFPSLNLTSSMGRIYQVVPFGSMPCIPIRENCLQTVVVTAPRRLEMGRVYATGKGSDVAKYFTDNAAAHEIFPDWDADYFSDVKAAILSGKYAFFTASETTDLMVEEGKSALDDYVLAFQYEVK